MGRETKIKIIGTGIFLILVLGIAYLVYHSNELQKKQGIESIKISGNYLLTENDYLTFTRLNNLEDNDHLSLSLIKSRFEKHPYISRTDVKYSDDRDIKIFINEKKIYGVIIKNEEALLAAENFEILPVFQNTKMIDIPVLSNVHSGDELKPLKKFTNVDVFQAYKIIDAADLTNVELLKDLAEINLRNGGDVVLTFSGLRVPVIFGRNNESSKMVSLEALLTNNIVEDNESDYIDLRFYNDIYIGHTRRVEL